MSEDITCNSYWKEINDLARGMIEETYEWLDKADMEPDEIIEDVMDQITDHVLHETIDGHQWVIYYAYNLDVIKFSNNSDYMVENFGNDEAGHILSKQGLDSLHTAIAFWAMYADVQDVLHDIHESVFDELMEPSEDAA